MISIIIPSYNRADTIRNSVLSVLNQTYKDIEVIIVDDNSTDNTEKIISDLKDSRLKYIKLDKNMGACYARNIGVENSKGDYIAFQDSDDIWLPEKLEKQINYLLEINADIVACSFINKNIDKSIRIPFKSPTGDVLFKDIIKENYVSTQTIIGKKVCFENEPFDHYMPRFQDWELVLRLCQKYKFSFLNEDLVEVYLQPNSISKNNINAVIALERIVEKNITYFNNNKKMLCFYYRRMGDFATNNKQANMYYWKAFNLQPLNLKNILKILKSKG